ncbi:MerR family transcriptional regulator [Clostridium tagluense]|uniref:GyrI-like domain-containing protein n=1 Tax=Clostridium tagluense TaxID=360422 RepID=UPI001CF530BD|nr:GyrI-like domain-containing protein [Clostridium tagluense]MCB2311389.1 MerR family transcriptional regulator [Clostridium tagluense]MCB2316113.1 MerR family transcriptional regulator [Clostridium tagluense]MCB2321085.1 MerR family transcriptional regulator [Clostridium tagluense]MCB2326100.1 MerR family transcriptional regulator [Clostridium tagluense]MCB2330823.1 MerR family transcriptional regulator [Clostridium tagluense]
MKDTFLIGELAKLFNISTDTLRHYDKIDLLKPNCDVENKYRFYSVRNFFKLSRILFFKNLDISLNDIKKYMNNKNTNNLMTLLKNKEEEIDVKINKLVNLKNKINTKLELLGNIKHELNIVKIKRLPQRIGVVLDIKDSKNEYELKECVKKNEKYLKLSSWLIEGQIYTSLSRENMTSGNFNKFKYFIEILSTENIIELDLITIPENEFAYVVFLGPYKDIENHYTVLIEWIEENGYEILGDSIEKNIVDYDFSDSENEYISEIQIPIRKLL